MYGFIFLSKSILYKIDKTDNEILYKMPIDILVQDVIIVSTSNKTNHPTTSNRVARKALTNLKQYTCDQATTSRGTFRNIL